MMGTVVAAWLVASLAGSAITALDRTDAEPVGMTDRLNPVADPKAVVIKGNARFTILTPSMVRLEWSPDGVFEDRASQVIVNRRLPVPTFEISEGGPLRTTTRPASTEGPAVLTIRADNVVIKYKQDGRRFSKDNLVVQSRVGSKEIWVDATPPFSPGGNLGGTTRTLDGISGACPLEPGLLNYTGWTFLDDSQTLLFDDGDQPWARPRQSHEALDWYVFSYGHDYQKALGEFIQVAGRIPLPPRFVFGAWWSRYWAYFDEELRDLVKQFQQNEVPLDVLVVDMDWHLDGWTGYTWNPKYFPDPEGFLKWAHEQGLKVTLNLHPAEGVGKQEARFTEMCNAMGLDPATTDRIPFDCTSKDYVNAYFNILHHPLEKQGVDFWWMDWQQGTRTNIEGLDPLWWLNYLHWTDQANRAKETGHRPLIFSRWGGLGNHRYEIGFSGDTFCNWPSLAFQPYFTSTAGNVGYAYWSHDIGGHQPGKVDPELYARWVQWGAFSPILRTHTTKNPDAERRPWAFPADVYAAAKKAYRLRYELIPYIYTMARKCYDTGLPLCRPLYYHWPESSESYRYRGEYMFGDDLLVAPVTEPADRFTGYSMTEVWLPPGDWTNWFTGQTYRGPRMSLQIVPLDEIPLFVRGGAVIPTQPPMHYSDEKPLNPLLLNIYAGSSGGARVYEDDGRSNGYTTGQCAWTPVTHQLSGDQWRITIGPTDGAYPGIPESRDYEVRVFDLPPGNTKLLVNGKVINAMSERAESTTPYWWYEKSVMGPTIYLPSVKRTEKMEIVIESPYGDGSLTQDMNGFRGLARRICQANQISHLTLLKGLYECDKNEFVFDILTDVANASDAIRQWRARWEKFIEITVHAQQEIQEYIKLLARLTGLYYKVRLSMVSPQSPQLNVDVVAATVLPVPAVKDLDVTVRLINQPGWRRIGDSEWTAHAPTEDHPLVANAILEGEGPIDTSLIRIGVSMKNEAIELGISIPVDIVILPSINAWHVLGPFDAPLSAGLGRVFPPEEKVDLQATYDGKGGKKIGWRVFRRNIRAGEDLTSEFFVDFDDVFGERVNDAVVYGFTYLDAATETDAVLALGSDDGVAVWLNGKEVHRNDVGRAYASRSDLVPVHLKEGRNTLLLKISQGGGDGGFCVRVENKFGKPIPTVKAKLE